jgi:hypothetical protein
VRTACDVNPCLASSDPCTASVTAVASCIHTML